jgi:hypothetical protein
MSKCLRENAVLERAQVLFSIIVREPTRTTTCTFALLIDTDIGPAYLFHAGQFRWIGCIPIQYSIPVLIHQLQSGGLGKAGLSQLYDREPARRKEPASYKWVYCFTQRYGRSQASTILLYYKCPMRITNTVQLVKGVWKNFQYTEIVLNRDPTFFGKFAKKWRKKQIIRRKMYSRFVHE